MILYTASAVVSYARQLEEEGALFYTEAADAHESQRERLLALAKENRRNATQVQTVYYGVISDALEGGFSFNLDTADYEPHPGVPGAGEPAATAGQALDMEERVIRFYTDAAEQSRSLLADIPRLFTSLAKKRQSRAVFLSDLRDA
jgi:rubrerythrin